MKKILRLRLALLLLVLAACKKDKTSPSEAEPDPVVTPAPANNDNYASLADFYEKNGVVMESFSFNAGSGGHFVSAKGTTVNIPANVFSPATAQVKIEFKDIYKKSDMLLTNMATNTVDGKPLKSAGEFFIKALVDNTPVAITDTAVGIQILQPFIETPDAGMTPFLSVPTFTNTLNGGWVDSPDAKLQLGAANYVYNLYQFQTTPGGGSWCNSDNAGFFAAYTQTKLNLHPSEVLENTDVFLVFKTVNSMVHVYKDIAGDYVYNYAPIGFECTVVTVGVKNGKLRASFTPITIGTNLTVNFTPTEITSEKFKTKLEALN